MNSRKQVLGSGQAFDVPKYIVRLDSNRTHGWQLRIGQWKLFSDHSNDGSGAQASLDLATQELARRIVRLPAPTRLRSDVLSSKVSELPLGISPAERHRPGKNFAQYYYQVTYPVVGRRAVNKSVYIATENTLTKEKQEAALAKAIAMRDAALRKFRQAANRAQREQAAKAGLIGTQ